MRDDEEDRDDSTWATSIRDAHLGYALNLSLNHVDAPAGSGAMFGSLAALRKDTDDDALLEMAATVLSGLVNRNPQAREDARRWHALRHGHKPDGDVMTILDLERQLRSLLQLYRRTDSRLGIQVGPIHAPSYTTIPIGVDAIIEFRSTCLVPRFGEKSPSAKQIKTWLDKLGQPKWTRGLTIPGIVGRIVHRGRPKNARRRRLEQTVQRVLRVLQTHGKRQD